MQEGKDVSSIVKTGVLAAEEGALLVMKASRIVKAIQGT